MLWKQFPWYVGSLILSDISTNFTKFDQSICRLFLLFFIFSLKQQYSQMQSLVYIQWWLHYRMQNSITPKYFHVKEDVTSKKCTWQFIWIFTTKFCINRGQKIVIHFHGKGPKALFWCLRIKKIFALWSPDSKMLIACLVCQAQVVGRKAGHSLGWKNKQTHKHLEFSKIINNW